jgi:hypothetical protein
MKLGQRKASILSSFTKRIVPIGRGPCEVEMRLFGKMHRLEIRRQFAVIANSGEQSRDAQKFAASVHQIWSSCRGARHYDLFTFAIDLGCRV